MKMNTEAKRGTGREAEQSSFQETEVKSSPTQTHQDVFIKKQCGNRIDRRGLGQLVKAAIPPAPCLPGEQASCKSYAVLFLTHFKKSVYIALKTKVVPYAEPIESYYNNAAFRQCIIAQLRDGTESHNTDTSKFSAISAPHSISTR